MGRVNQQIANIASEYKKNAIFRCLKMGAVFMNSEIMLEGGRSRNNNSFVIAIKTMFKIYKSICHIRKNTTKFWETSFEKAAVQFKNKVTEKNRRLIILALQCYC